MFAEKAWENVKLNKNWVFIIISYFTIPQFCKAFIRTTVLMDCKITAEEPLLYITDQQDISIGNFYVIINMYAMCIYACIPGGFRRVLSRAPEECTSQINFDFPWSLIHLRSLEGHCVHSEYPNGALLVPVTCEVFQQLQPIMVPSIFHPSPKTLENQEENMPERKSFLALIWY